MYREQMGCTAAGQAFERHRRANDADDELANAMKLGSHRPRLLVSRLRRSPPKRRRASSRF